MSRLRQITDEGASDRARTLLDIVKYRLGLVPNMTRAMANSPAAFDGYLQFSGALARGTLPARVREQITHAVAQANGCEYCLAAHSAIGKTVGLTAEQIRDSRLGGAVDPRAATLIRFALEVLRTAAGSATPHWPRCARPASTTGPSPRWWPTSCSIPSPTSSTPSPGPTWTSPKPRRWRRSRPASDSRRAVHER